MLLRWIAAGGEATNRPISTADGLQLKLPEGERGASPALADAFEPVTLESLPPFTLVAATTETATLPKPLVMRFPIRELLKWYETDDLARIVGRAAVRSGTTLTVDAARVIARAGRDTPRESIARRSSLESAERSWPLP